LKRGENQSLKELDMTALNIAAIISIIVIGVVAVVLLFAVAMLLMAVKNLTMEIREHIGPLATKANSLLITANEMAEKVQDRTDNIADQAAHTTTVVGHGVESTSWLLQRLIAAPIIRGSATAAGFRRGIMLWKTLRRVRKQQHAGGYSI